MDEAVTKPEPCPFCGEAVGAVERPCTPGEGGGYVCFIACFCGDYSAHAHQHGKGDTPDAARAEAIAAWNRRSQPSAPRAEAVEAKEAPTRDELVSALTAFVNWEGSRNPNGDDTLLPPERQLRPFVAAAMRTITAAAAEDQRERELFGDEA